MKRVIIYLWKENNAIKLGNGYSANDIENSD